MLLAVGVVDQHRVAVAEGAAAGVLAGDAHVGALEEQRPVGQRLGQRPVDLAVGPHLVARLELLAELGVDVERLGSPGQRAVDVVEHLTRHAGVDVGQDPDRRRRRLGQDLGGRRGLAGLLQRGLEPLLEVVERALRLLEAQLAPLDQRLGEQLPHRAPLVDLGVHERLRVARVVALVVAVAAVADHVDHDVLAEPLPVGERQPGDPHAGLGVVAVHVEDRRLDDLGHVGRVEARARRLGGGRVADLVVDDEVDGAADPVALDVAHVEGLGHHALAGEGGVAVHEDRQDREGGRVVDGVLLGPGHPDRRPDRPPRGGSGWRPARAEMSLPERATNFPTWPRWYFTSPEPWIDSGSTCPSNSLKSWS